MKDPIILQGTDMNLNEFKVFVSDLITGVISRTDALAAEQAARIQDLSAQLVAMGEQVAELKLQIETGGYGDLQPFATELEAKVSGAKAKATEIAANANPTPVADGFAEAVANSDAVETPASVEAAIDDTVNQPEPTSQDVVTDTVDAIVSAV